MEKKYLICLTGGIASGKSRVTTWLQSHDWHTVCADEIVHRLYAPDQELPKVLAREFGATILSAEGRVNRQRLGELVFGHPDRLARLNALVHPQVRNAWQREIRAAVAEIPVVVTIPLAFETGAPSEFGQTWVVACSVQEQKRRLVERGLTARQIEDRLAAQWPLQRKMDLADRVIWNEGAWELTELQLVALEKERRCVPTRESEVRSRYSE